MFGERLSAEQKNSICAMYKEGKTIAEIAEALHINEQKVTRILADRGYI